jgi:hypothetical protein
VFWGCSNYPKCDYTTNFEPIGALHDADDGPVAKRGDGFICLKDGAAIEVPGEGSVVGLRLPGGPPDPAALAPARRGGGKGGGARRTGGRKSTRRSTRSSPSATRPRS